MLISKWGSGRATPRSVRDRLRRLRDLCVEPADDERRSRRHENGSRARPPVTSTLSEGSRCIGPP